VEANNTLEFEEFEPYKINQIRSNEIMMRNVLNDDGE
jgi:hypothetical protein